MAFFGSAVGSTLGSVENYWPMLLGKKHLFRRQDAFVTLPQLHRVAHAQCVALSRAATQKVAVACIQELNQTGGIIVASVLGSPKSDTFQLDPPPWMA